MQNHKNIRPILFVFALVLALLPFSQVYAAFKEVIVNVPPENKPVKLLGIASFEWYLPNIQHLVDITPSISLTNTATKKTGTSRTNIPVIYNPLIHQMLLSQGWAIAYNTPKDYQEEFFSYETYARLQTRNIWHYITIKDAVDLQTSTPHQIKPHHFSIIEGEVAAVKHKKGYSLLNFSDDWHTDFTLKIYHNIFNSQTDAENHINLLTGKTIQVRGWMQNYNGPFIEVQHLGQIIPLTQNMNTNAQRF